VRTHPRDQFAYDRKPIAADIFSPMLMVCNGSKALFRASANDFRSTINYTAIAPHRIFHADCGGLTMEKHGWSAGSVGLCP